MSFLLISINTNSRHSNALSCRKLRNIAKLYFFGQLKTIQKEGKKKLKNIQRTQKFCSHKETKEEPFQPASSTTPIKHGVSSISFNPAMSFSTVVQCIDTVAGGSATLE